MFATFPHLEQPDICIGYNRLFLTQDIHLGFTMRAVTAKAAHVLNAERGIGSICVGRLADLTNLEPDPLETPLEDLSDNFIRRNVLERKPRRFLA